MDMTCFSVPLTGSVSVPVSKNEVHSQMICAGLTHDATALDGIVESADMAATARCLKALGQKPEQTAGTLTNAGHGEKSGKLPVLDCGESGSTLRFFVPLALAVSGGAVFRMHGRLSHRPMDAYRDLFVPRGVRWRMGVGCDGAAELTVRGELEPGRYVMPGSVTSQFAAGLLFALPLLDGDSTLTITLQAGCAASLRMTIEALRKIGIRLEETGANSWHIPGRQRYHTADGQSVGVEALNKSLLAFLHANYNL